MEISISRELHFIIGFARQEAVRTGNRTIKSDHLYLGILRQRVNEAFEYLSHCVNVDEFKRHIDNKVFTDETISWSQSEQIGFSITTRAILSFCIIEASRSGSGVASTRHLLLALSMDDESNGTYFLRGKGIDYRRIHDYFKNRPMRENPTSETTTFTFNGDESDVRSRMSSSSGPRRHSENASDDGAMPFGMDADGMQEGERLSPLAEFGTDITKAAVCGQLDPIVGREEEIQRVLQILGRRKKNNPMLVGDSGVGKTAIVEGIAMKIASGDAPEELLKKRIISLDIASIVAGTKYRGEFEKRIKEIIEEISKTPDIIVFMDEIHTLVGAGEAHGGLDAANIFKPALARGEIHCIGATTYEEFAQTVEKDKALDRRFQKVPVLPTSVAQTIEILERIRPYYEKYHSVKYDEKAMEDCVRMSERYITDRCLPDKAIDILDEAGSMVHLRVSGGQGNDIGKYVEQRTVTRDDIAAVVSKMTGIPVGNVVQSQSEKIANMGPVLKSKIIGQDDAVDTLVRAIRRNSTGLKDPRRPIGAFLFVGPTGVGKTLLAKLIAEYLFDSVDNLIRVDMNEYIEKFNVSRLIGAPPGYVGYDEGGQLSERVRRNPYSVVLLDEIEKAHPDIYNILLQIIDEGRLTDSSGRFVDFRNTVLIMTSNAGSRESDEYGKGLGFASASANVDAAKKAIVEKSIRRIFPPEFIGRIDEQIFFNSLNMDDMAKIIDIEVAEIAERISEYGLKLHITPAAKRLIMKAGYDPKFGARPLKRAIRDYVEDPVSEFIISHNMLAHNECSPITLKVGMSEDRQSTRVLNDSAMKASSDAVPTESPLEDEILKSMGENLDGLYANDLQPHLAGGIWDDDLDPFAIITKK